MVLAQDYGLQYSSVISLEIIDNLLYKVLLDKDDCSILYCDVSNIKRELSLLFGDFLGREKFLNAMCCDFIKHLVIFLKGDNCNYRVLIVEDSIYNIYDNQVIIDNFLSSNYLGSFVLESGDSLSGVLSYGLDNKVCLQGALKDFSKYSNPDNDSNGDWVSSDPSANGVNGSNYPIRNPYTGEVDYPPAGRCWAFNEKTFVKNVAMGRIVFKREYKVNERGFIYKRYAKDVKNKYNPMNTLDYISNRELFFEHLKNSFAESKIQEVSMKEIINDFLNSLSEKDVEYLKERVGANYGLVWEKPLVRDYDVNKLKVSEVSQLFLKNSENNMVHEFYEGDNYHSLQYLRMNGAKVDFIYIDPPYNTGNSFVYSDKFNSNKKSLYKHSEWLEFMFERLEIAKDLLKDEGIIVLSIDDNEVAQLKLLCDKVFGEENFVVDFIRKTKSTTNNKSNGVNIQHENTLVYAKNINKIPKLQGSLKDFSTYSNPDNDSNGDWFSDNPSAPGRGSENTNFIITNPYTGKVDYPPAGRCWAFTKDLFDDYVEQGKIVFKRKHKVNERGFIYKRYAKDVKSQYNTIDSLQFADNKYLNQVGSKELKDLNMAGFFEFPKNTNLIKDLITMYPKNDITVLDFFAGSGTTGHAVLLLNKEDNGSRKFILCTNNDNNIARDVTWVRLEKVIHGYTNFKNVPVSGIPANLNYYVVDYLG